MKLRSARAGNGWPSRSRQRRFKTIKAAWPALFGPLKPLMVAGTHHAAGVLAPAPWRLGRPQGHGGLALFGLPVSQLPTAPANSFVSYIIRHSKARLKRYIRGPGMDGADMISIASSGYQFVRLALAANTGARVLLTGYSRGGAGVIAVAQKLKADGVRVAAMMLFDAVDRAIGIDTAQIPVNIDRVVYARRDPSAESRGSFGNCGTSWRAPTKVERQYFRGTHGAIGGAPWKCPPDKKPTDLIDEGWPDGVTKITYERDLACAREVWAWINPRLNAQGFLGNRTFAQAYVAR